MSTLKYKSYAGIVSYSEEDEVFFGKVEGVNALINFEGESVKELKKAFEEAIDDYLAYCEAEGLSPEKTYTGVLNIRISPDIHSRIAVLARETGTTINGYIKQALENQLKVAHQ